VLRSSSVARGRVVDALTGEPISSFSLRRGYAEEIHFNDPKGRFALRPVSSGSLEVTIEASGYLPSSQKIPCQVEEDAEETLIELKKPETLRGRAIDALTLAPVGNASVYYVEKRRHRSNFEYIPNACQINWGKLDGPLGGYHCSQTARSGPDGLFAFTETSDEGGLLLQAKGYERAVVPFSRRPSRDAPGVVSIPLHPGASISGVFLSEDRPKSAVSVHLQSVASGQRWDRENRFQQTFPAVRTDARGRFAWDRLGPGEFVVSATLGEDDTSRRSVSTRIELGRGEQKRVELRDEVGAWELFGTVRLGDVPLSDANINLEPLFDSALGPRRGQSDAQGLYHIQGLRPGRYAVSISRHFREKSRTRQLKSEIEIEGSTQRDFRFEVEHSARFRLAFPAEMSQADRDSFTEARIRVSRNIPSGRKGHMSNSDIATSAKAPIQNGQGAFVGRFSGQYELTMQGGGALGSVEVSELLLLDNLRGDQNLGQISAPGFGYIRFQIAYSSEAEPRPDSVKIELHREENRDRKTTRYSLRPEHLDQTVGPHQAGNYEVRISAPAYSIRQSAELVEVRHGQIPIVAAFLTPD
jgi:hypothetical protein